MCNERLLIGLGTGRCGTVSLSILLNLQEDTRVMHEAAGWPFKHQRTFLSWSNGGATRINGSKKEEFWRFLEAFPASGKFTGDVGYYYLAYVETIISLWPDVRFVCLQRNRQQTIDSLMDKAERTNRNPWQNHGGTQWSKAATYSCWPKFNDAATREGACSAYYDFYYEEARKYKKMFPERFQIFQTDALNNAHGVERILDFCGFDKPIIASGIHRNRRQA